MKQKLVKLLTEINLSHSIHTYCPLLDKRLNHNITTYHMLVWLMFISTYVVSGFIFRHELSRLNKIIKGGGDIYSDV